ncbi:MAG: hypothetical protein AABY16_04610 [Nanoarchaeota archaeon]
MAKVKEIKKITSPIKEVKPEKKETLEEEVEESAPESEAEFRLWRRGNASSTLAQTEAPQETAGRQRITAKEDEAEMNFRPSYTGGGNPYQSNKYTPVGAAESGAAIAGRAMNEQTLNQQDRFIGGREVRGDKSSSDTSSMGRPESGSERAYAGQQDQKEKERRRQSM